MTYKHKYILQLSYNFRIHHPNDLKQNTSRLWKL